MSLVLTGSLFFWSRLLPFIKFILFRLGRSTMYNLGWLYSNNIVEQNRCIYLCLIIDIKSVLDMQNFYRAYRMQSPKKNLVNIDDGVV